MPRFKDILCDVSSGFDVSFMLNDKEGTACPDYAFHAVRDEFFEDDLKAAKAHMFASITVYDPTKHELEIRKI